MVRTSTTRSASTIRHRAVKPTPSRFHRRVAQLQLHRAVRRARAASLAPISTRSRRAGRTNFMRHSTRSGRNDALQGNTVSGLEGRQSGPRVQSEWRLGQWPLIRDKLFFISTGKSRDKGARLQIRREHGAQRDWVFARSGVRHGRDTPANNQPVRHILALTRLFLPHGQQQGPAAGLNINENQNLPSA
jgi:hypothetical protein